MSKRKTSVTRPNRYKVELAKAVRIAREKREAKAKTTRRVPAPTRATQSG